MYNKMDNELKLGIFDDVANSKSVFDFVTLLNYRLRENGHGELINVVKESIGDD